MTFYQACLGGELYFQTINDSPFRDRFSKKLRNLVLHSRLDHEDTSLLATDMVEDRGLVRGNAVSLLVDCRSEREVRKFFNRLSAGGSFLSPVKRTSSETVLGSLTDRYGNNWILKYSERVHEGQNAL